MMKNLYSGGQNSFVNAFDNLHNAMIENMQNINNEMIAQIDNLNQKIESGEYAVDSKEINGVTFVVISNSNQPE